MMTRPILALILIPVLVSPCLSANSRLTPPDLLNPPDGQDCIGDWTPLVWGPVDGALGYEVQFGEGCGAGQVYTASAPPFSAVFLEAGKVYSWRVRVQGDNGDWSPFSDCFEFMTQPQTPAPTLLQPPDHSSCLPAELTLDWADVEGAVGYRVQIGWECGAGSETVVNSSRLPVAGLTPGVGHWWHVQAKNECGYWGDYSDCFLFSTDSDAPSPPALASPEDRALICQSWAGLYWAAAQRAVQYRLQIGTECGSGAEYITNEGWFPYTNLDSGETYYWRLCARSLCSDWGEYSECRSFIASPAALAAPHLCSPESGSICVPVSGVLEWLPVTGATSYVVQLDPECGGGEQVEVTSSQFAYEGLDPGVNYHWRVKALNECETPGAFSACDVFMTDVQDIDPPVLLSPADGAGSMGTSWVLSWEPVEHASGYRIQIGKACGQGEEVQISGTEYKYRFLEPSTTYYWRVCALTPCGNVGDYSGCFTFATTSDPKGILNISELGPNPVCNDLKLEVYSGAVQNLGVYVYDTTGRLVRVVAHGLFDGGPHRFTWDRCHDNGEELPSGVYFVVARAGKAQVGRRVVLLR
ncbi:MAG: hypothetical protein KJ970_16785 [Candidatus Eisenbacteria bacterium]|uniref:Fibronectin type-III domain-containing protein n=1 Tax=Eiseniibacteriota bacterium TaxID=2212470 RepID=A0A948W4T5_UNCEI|nr:hypothetical protein [Candidatus Eisenbacteria bacterium]MBU1948099.1 hypothetical protein [Candidatus Eisenbacteria bacterium]MBU2692572.1 hypothetical protein [Candidatus Eisenbacteria bacterium]